MLLLAVQQPVVGKAVFWRHRGASREESIRYQYLTLPRGSFGWYLGVFYVANCLGLWLEYISCGMGIARGKQLSTCMRAERGRAHHRGGGKGLTVAQAPQQIQEGCRGGHPAAASKTTTAGRGCFSVAQMPAVRFEYDFPIVVTPLEKNYVLRAGEEPCQGSYSSAPQRVCAEGKAGGCRKVNKGLGQAGVFSTFNVYTRQVLLPTFLLTQQKADRSCLVDFRVAEELRHSPFFFICPSHCVMLYELHRY